MANQSDDLGNALASAYASCPQCGGTFACEPLGDCWCKAEPYRLPLATAGNAERGAMVCICPACLRKAAEAAS